MKYRMVKCVFACLICALVLLGCKAKEGKNADYKLSKNASYALGMNLGSNMKDDNITTNIAEFRKGISDVLDNKKMRFALDEINDVLNAEFAAMEEDDMTLSADASYALGASIGMSMKQDTINLNTSEFFKGLNDAVGNKKTRFDADKARDILNAEFAAKQQKDMEQAEAKRAIENEGLRQEEIEFLVENSKKPGIIITPSGLQYEVITEGKGARPGPESMVRVHYEGTLADGTVFDSSYARNEPAEFELGWVIPGWIEGLQLMREGSVYTLYVPSELGYGAEGSWGGIPPYAPLIFKVELLSIIEARSE